METIQVVLYHLSILTDEFSVNNIIKAPHHLKIYKCYQEI